MRERKGGQKGRRGNEREKEERTRGEERERGGGEEKRERAGEGKREGEGRDRRIGKRERESFHMEIACLIQQICVKYVEKSILAYKPKNVQNKYSTYIRSEVRFEFGKYRDPILMKANYHIYFFPLSMSYIEARRRHEIEKYRKVKAKYIHIHKIERK